MTYLPGREARFHHVGDTIAHVEEHNCSLGCRQGARNAAERRELGPGGSCDVLARLAFTDPVTELDDDGRVLTCKARQPLPERAPRQKKPRPAPAGQLTIGEQ